MIEITVINNINDTSLRDKWNNLLDSTANPLPFQRYEWIKSFVEERLSGRDELFIMLAKRADELVGIAPFVKRDIFFSSFSRISFIGTGYFDYFDFIIKPGMEREVLSTFISNINHRLKKFEIDLRNIFDCSFTTKIIAKDAACGSLNVLKYFEGVVPYLDLPSRIENFYAAIKNKLRADIERQKRRLNREGELKLVQCKKLNDALATLEGFFSLHIKRWESNGGYSAYKFAHMRNLMRAILKNLFSQRIANIYYLAHNKKKIAICFTYSIGGRFIYYAPSYDPDYAVYSPGKILVGMLIDTAIESGMHEFDFGIGDEAYKLEWSPKNKKLCTFYIFSKSNSLAVFIIKICFRIRAGYTYFILPRLRKIIFLVHLWRFMRRKLGSYRRFE